MKKSIMLTVVMTTALMVMVHAEEAVVVDWTKHFRKDGLMNFNPSLFPVSNDCMTVRDSKSFVERYRIVCDVNNDGINDLILSDRISSFGKSDGSWSIYVSTNALWRYIGMVSFREDRFLIERTWEGINIWAVEYSSASEGTVWCHRVANGKVEENAVRMEIKNQEGDVETSVSDRIAGAITSHPGNHPFHLEESETSDGGVVSWKFVRDHRKPCMPSEAYDLNERAKKAERRAAKAEKKLGDLLRVLNTYEQKTMGLCGIRLGEKWKGGELSRPCEEIFSGFTNMTIKLDAAGFVQRIRLTRREDKATLAAVKDVLNTKPTPEEQKIIHEIENYFHIRLHNMSTGNHSQGREHLRRGYYRSNFLAIDQICVLFANGYTTDSYIDMIYSREFVLDPYDEDKCPVL